jgi:predicted kinase
MVWMTTLCITRGLPGSGKSTLARAWVLEDPRNRAEVNRDSIRDMLHGGHIGSHEQEAMVTVISHTAIKDLLKRGVSVVCSDTNLPQRHARDLAKIARSLDCEVEVWDMTNVPLATCIERNARRLDKLPVPVSVIEQMYERFVKTHGYPLPFPVENSADFESDVYIPDETLPKAVIVDIDGTMAHMVSRGPHDYHRVKEDIPDPVVIMIVRAIASLGINIVFMSGRPVTCYGDTLEWLHEHYAGPFSELIMRNEDDNRNDAIVKFELFNDSVRMYYYVLFTIDDRNRVVDMWRDKLGIKCVQVAEGNF